jgi:hypothetical protein
MRTPLHTPYSPAFAHADAAPRCHSPFLVRARHTYVHLQLHHRFLPGWLVDELDKTPPAAAHLRGTHTHCSSAFGIHLGATWIVSSSFFCLAVVNICLPSSGLPIGDRWVAAPEQAILP